MPQLPHPLNPQNEHAELGSVEPGTLLTTDPMDIVPVLPELLLDLAPFLSCELIMVSEEIRHFTGARGHTGSDVTP